MEFGKLFERMPLPKELVFNIFRFVPLLELSEMGASEQLLSAVHPPYQGHWGAARHKRPFPLARGTCIKQLERISEYTLTFSFDQDAEMPDIVRVFLSPGLFAYMVKHYGSEFMEQVDTAAAYTLL